MEREHSVRLTMDDIYGLVPIEFKMELEKLKPDIEKRLASIDMAGEILSLYDLSDEDSLALKRLREQAMSELCNILLKLMPQPELLTIQNGKLAAMGCRVRAVH